MSTRIEPILTVRELDLMPDDGNRYEIIDGELCESKTPGLFHQLISGRVHFSIESYLRKNPIGHIISTPGITSSEVDGVIPDLVFVSHVRLQAILKSDRLHGTPELVVEILSPGSDNSRRDRLAKHHLYSKFGVAEYWILDPETRSVEVYVHDGRNLISAGLLSGDDALNSSVLPGYRTPVTDFFAV